MASSTNSAALIIAPQLNDAFGETLVHNLITRKGIKVIALTSPSNGTEVPASFGPSVATEKLEIAFGLPGSKKTISRIVSENEIKTVFLLVAHNIDQQSSADAAADSQPPSFVARNRNFLIQLCSLLETLRQCSPSPPTLVPIFIDSNAKNDLLIIRQGNLGLTAAIQCHTEGSARFSSAFALFHSFAVSYHLNIQIALLEGKAKELPTERTLDFVFGLAEKREGKAAINFAGMEVTEQQKQEKFSATQSIPMGRVLLFGSHESIEKAKVMDPEFQQLADRAQLFEATSKPGLNPDEAVEQEILASGASHVVFVHGADEQTVAGWESGGPAQLRDNVRHNLFAPWLLGHLCDEMGLIFILLEEEEEEEEEEREEEISSANEAKSRYKVVRHFAGSLDGMRSDPKRN